VPSPVVQQFLDGPEFTIDVLCDFEGRVLSVVPRERVVVRAGVVDRGRTVADPALVQLGLRCASVLRFVGAVNIQCRMVGRRPVVFEINPRFSGGIPLTIAAGADFPHMLVELALGRAVVPAVGKFLEDVWMTNYESSVFLSAAAIGFSSRVSALSAVTGLPAGAATAREVA
jgi:carbamoyl-phosphate synthase large subunit